MENEMYHNGAERLDENEAIRKIAKRYGFEAQSRQTIEECAELIQAINKFWRAEKFGTDLEKRENTIRNICEEIADLKIMLSQIELLLAEEVEHDFYIPGLISNYRKEKIRRQLQRLPKIKIGNLAKWDYDETDNF